MQQDHGDARRRKLLGQEHRRDVARGSAHVRGRIGVRVRVRVRLVKFVQASGLKCTSAYWPVGHTFRAGI